MGKSVENNRINKACIHSANIKRIIPFIKSTLKDEEAEEFLEHIKECKSCSDELEIYYLIETELNSESKPDKQAALNEFTISEYKRLSFLNALKIAYYTLNTLVVLSVVLSVLLQIRVWLF